MSAGLFFDILRRDWRVSWAAKITNEWTLNKGGEIEGTVRQCQSKYTTTTTTTNSSSSSSSSSRNEYYLGGIIALLPQDHCTM